jgi:hypothetical protein
MISGLPRNTDKDGPYYLTLVENGRGELFVMAGYSERCNSRANKSANRGHIRTME